MRSACNRLADRLALWSVPKKDRRQPFQPLPPSFASPSDSLLGLFSPSLIPPQECLFKIEQALSRRTAHRLEMATPYSKPLPSTETLTCHWIPGPEPNSVPKLALLIPPWRSVSPKALSRPLKSLHRKGYDVLLYHSPDHFGRRPRGARAGSRFLSWNLPQTWIAYQQSVFEIDQIAQALLRLAKPITLVGMSLGGQLAALTLAHRGGFAEALLIAPLVSLEETMTSMPLGVLYRKTLDTDFDIVLPQVRKLSRCLDPSRYACQIPAEDVAMILARDDGIVPNQGIGKLKEQWRLSRFEAHHEGHITLLFRDRTSMNLLGTRG